MFVLIDTISLPGYFLDEFINKINKMRDPTHIRSYTKNEWLSIILKSKLKVIDVKGFRNEYNLQDWLKRAETNEDKIRQIKQLIINCDNKIKSQFDIVYTKNTKTFAEDNIIITCRKIR